MVYIVEELGYREVDTLWYMHPIFRMHILADEKGVWDIIDRKSWCRRFNLQNVWNATEMIEGEVHDNELNDGGVNYEEVNECGVCDIKVNVGVMNEGDIFGIESDDVSFNYYNIKYSTCKRMVIN